MTSSLTRPLSSFYNVGPCFNTQHLLDSISTIVNFFSYNDFVGTGQTRIIVNDLARDMKIDPELSTQLATLSHSAQPYLYAISTPVTPAKQNSAKYDYADAIQEQKLSKANVKPAKPSRAPQPLSHQHLQVKGNYLGLDPKLRRPLSLTDLKPPPNLPPPPLPKNGMLSFLETRHTFLKTPQTFRVYFRSHNFLRIL